MSDRSFGKSFHIVMDGKSHYIRDLLIKGIMVLGPLTPVPWLFHFAGTLPRMTKDWLAYRAWVLVQFEGEDENRSRGIKCHVVAHQSGG